MYNKTSGSVIGFTSIGDINDDLLKLEREEDDHYLVKQVLVLMVRGTMFKLSFPYAHFGTEGITADLLYPIVWEAVRRLEVKVISVTADGASPNRKFFRMHQNPKVNAIPTSIRSGTLTLFRVVGFISLPTHHT